MGRYTAVTDVCIEVGGDLFEHFTWSTRRALVISSLFSIHCLASFDRQDFRGGPEMQ